MTLSVLMSVYFREKADYLRSALESLAKQIVMADEVVLVEDGPIPADLAGVIDDFRVALNIKSVRLSVNAGLAAALNAGLQACSAELVARMDSDDQALPDRFRLQVEFMQSHPEVVVCSSAIEERNEDMTVGVAVRRLPLVQDEILRFARLRSPISHPAAIFRRDVVLGVGGYPLLYPEDYALWSLLLSKGYRFANLPDITLAMRAGDGFVERRGRRFFSGVVGVIWFQKKIRFIGWGGVFVSLIYRAGIHLAPASVRRYLYGRLRSGGVDASSRSIY